MATEDVEKIYARVIDDVLTCKPRVVLLDGPWGAGKTHALTLLRTLAREKGLATSSTILEGSGASLCDPLRLLTCVTGSICYPDSVLPVSIGDRLLDGRRSPSVIYKLRMAGANILADVLDALSEESLVSQEIRHTVEDYLAGALPASRAKQKLRELDCRANLPPVLARSVNERSGRFVLMLQNWAHFAALTGAKGLIVILDELDVEYALHRDYRGLREQLLTELKALTNRSAPLLVACAAAPADGANGDVDGQDAVKNVLKHLRSAVTHIRVPSPSGADLLTLFGRLITAYNEAYPPFALAGDETMADSLFAQLYRRYRKRLDAGPRYFIRSAVELFDVIATSGVTTAPEVCTLLASTSEDD